jgi:hypothetical protein
MANSVAMREAQKRELIEVIKQQLAQENPSLTLIVQDAARLALISQKYDYGMLFKAHLEGQYPQPNSTVPSNFYDNFREKVVQDFQSDR